MSEQVLSMPRMGESINEGTVLEWMVQPGESFEEGDTLLEVGTDKVDNEVPAPSAGIMGEHLASKGEVIEVGAPLAHWTAIEGGTKQAAETKSTSTATSDSKIPKKKAPKAKPTATTKGVNINLHLSPLVKAMALQHGIPHAELARITGTGQDHRITKSDLTQYINDDRPYQFAQPDPAAGGFVVPQLNFDKGTGREVPMDRMRKMIADHMVYSVHTSPHVTAYVEADLTGLVRFRESEKKQFQETHGVKLTYTPLLIQAVAKAIQDFPMINSSLDGDTIIVKDDINIGMATALPTGNLIVPVVRNADQKELHELAQEVTNLATKARENNLSGDDMKGGTFTISNVGTFGSLMGTPIINQPEVAILATGIIKKRAEVITRNGEDSIEIRSMMMLSLSFDHRVVDGYLAGSYLRRIADYLEERNGEL